MAAQPLIYSAEVLGVLAVFDRKRLSEEEFRWLLIFADHAARSGDIWTVSRGGKHRQSFQAT